MNETRRHLDRCGRQGLRRQGTRPVGIVQDDQLRRDELHHDLRLHGRSDTDAPLFRLAVEPTERNGLRIPCHLMVDKVTTVPKSKVGAHIGATLDDEDILRLNRAVLVFLGLATSPQNQEGMSCNESVSSKLFDAILLRPIAAQERGRSGNRPIPGPEFAVLF